MKALGRTLDPLHLPIAVLLLALALRAFWPVVAGPAPGVDYFQFWLVGKAAATVHGTDIYFAAGRSELTQFGRRLAAADPGARRLAVAVGYRRMVETFSTPFLYFALGAVAT